MSWVLARGTEILKLVREVFRNDLIMHEDAVFGLNV